MEREESNPLNGVLKDVIQSAETLAKQIREIAETGGERVKQEGLVS